MRKKEKEKEDDEKRALRKTTRDNGDGESKKKKKGSLTLRHRCLVPRALLVHRDDRRVVFEPRLAHLAAVHLGFPALLSWWW